MLTRCYSTNYKGHDIAYQNRREQGLPGWDNAKQLKKSISNIAFLLSKVQIPVHGKILDVGCGAGNLCFWLERSGYEVTGIDVSSVAIEWARDNAKTECSHAEFYVMDATQKMDLPQSSFDVIIDNNCLHCIIGKDRYSFLGNVHNLLKPDGYYLLSTMCSEQLNVEALPNFDNGSKCIIVKQTALRYIGTPEGILQELKVAGFDLHYHMICHDEDSAVENVQNLLTICRKQSLF